MVHALHRTVRQGVSHIDNPKIDKVIEDCKLLTPGSAEMNESVELSWITDEDPLSGYKREDAHTRQCPRDAEVCI